MRNETARIARRVLVSIMLLLLGGLIVTSCSPPGGGGAGFPMEGDVRPESDVEVEPGSYTIDSLTLPPGVTMHVDGSLSLVIDGDLDIQGTLDVDGRLDIEVNGDTEIEGTVSASSGAAAAGQRATAASIAPTDADAPLADAARGMYLVANGDVTVGPGATLEVEGPLVITDDPDQLSRTPNEVNQEAETASGSAPTLVPLPPDDPVFAASGPSATRVTPTQAPRTILLGGNLDMRGWPGNRPVVLFRFNGAADLVLAGLGIQGPKGVTPPERNENDDPGTNASGDDGLDGMNLNIWNNGGSITVTGTTVFALTDGGDGGDATVTCATATGGDGGNAGNFRMTASGGIDIQGTLRIEPGDGGDGGNATATGTAGCDVTANGGDGASVRKALYVRGNVTGIDGIEIGDQNGGAGGSATATAGDGTDGEPCEDGMDGGNATATGGNGGDSTISASAAVNVTGAATAGVGGAATATGGQGGDGGDCPGGNGGTGGQGGDATATGGDAGDETAAAAGGTAAANGGDGGNGGDTCGPPDGTGGNGGVGGPATATGGLASDGATRSATSGVGGAGGNGGNGATPGSGVAGGLGTGTPDDLADGAAGIDGLPCASPPPPPPTEVRVQVDFSAIPEGPIADGATYCLPVEDVEGQADTSNLFVQVAFDYGNAALLDGQDLQVASFNNGSAMEIFGLMYLTLVLSSCNDPSGVVLANVLLFNVLNVQNRMYAELLVSPSSLAPSQTWTTVATIDSSGPVIANASSPASDWRLRNEVASQTTVVAMDGFEFEVPASTFE